MRFAFIVTMYLEGLCEKLCPSVDAVAFHIEGMYV